MTYINLILYKKQTQYRFIIWHQVKDPFANKKGWVGNEKEIIIVTSNYFPDLPATTYY
jgi:hypothetical protein